MLTGGGPPIVGADVAVGYTDILISFTYDLAIAGGRGYQFGLAASVTTIIFLIVLLISAISFLFAGIRSLDHSQQLDRGLPSTF